MHATLTTFHFHSCTVDYNMLSNAGVYVFI